MVCAPVRSIIPSLKLGDYLSVQAHRPCSISHVNHYRYLLFCDFFFAASSIYYGSNPAASENKVIKLGRRLTNSQKCF